MNWFQKIKENNPEVFGESRFRSSYDWYKLKYINNPHCIPPNLNPSQYEFDVRYFHIVNKKRGIRFAVSEGRFEFKKIFKKERRTVNRFFGFGFNFTK